MPCTAAFVLVPDGGITSPESRIVSVGLHGAAGTTSVGTTGFHGVPVIGLIGVGKGEATLLGALFVAS